MKQKSIAAKHRCDEVDVGVLVVVDEMVNRQRSTEVQAPVLMSLGAEPNRLEAKAEGPNHRAVNLLEVIAVANRVEPSSRETSLHAKTLDAKDCRRI